MGLAGVCFAGVGFAGVGLAGAGLGAIAFGGPEDTLRNVMGPTGDTLTDDFVITPCGGDVGPGPLDGLIVLCVILLMIERMLLRILSKFGELGDGPCPG